ncbi:hypothetical protein APHAL10511_005432 [Amanita phalloides]|nr:hypothetical protein APHAL10511_005432 [Amanita phalloides]
MTVNSAILLNCKAGPCSSWSSTLRSVLIPAPRLITHVQNYNNLNPRRNRHPPGLIWKQTLGHCVYHDLSGEEKLGFIARQRRRFARLESLSLSGVILYEIPAGRDSETLTPGEAPMQMTLKTIFGDPTDASEAGMDVNDLLDAIGAQVIYFPSYACTSFITGQVMSAFFQQEPMIRPLPACEGFSVDANAFVDSSFTVGTNFALASCESFPSFSLFSSGSSTAISSSIPLIKVHPATDDFFFRNPFMDEVQHQLILGLPSWDRNSGYVEEGYQNGFDVDIGQELASDLSEQNLTRRLCGEVETLDDINGLPISHQSVLSLVLDDYSPIIPDEVAAAEKDDGNTSISTLDSGGPCTPPRSSSPVLSDMENEYSSDSILNKYATLAKRRRRKRLSLSLCSAYDTGKDVNIGPNSEDRSTLSSLPSVDFLTESEPELSQEPLTPIMTNFPGGLGSQDRTPTHARTPIVKPLRPHTQGKVTSRTGVGKENIAPLPVRSRRG